MEKFVIGLVGGFGGIAPSLVDKAQALYGGEVEKWLKTADSPLISIGCAFVAILVYFVIGAAIALIYKEQQLQKALLLGIGAPALIMAATQSGANSPQQISIGPQAGLFGLVGSAYAQDTGETPQLDLKVNPNWEKGKCQTCDIKFLGKDGQIIAREPLTQGEQAPVALDVPKNTRTIVLSGANANPATIDVQSLGSKLPQQQGPVTLDLGVNRSYWNDLTRSFGAKSVQPYDFSVDVAR
ncbi:hypothetical protein [Rhizobium binxianense]